MATSVNQPMALRLKFASASHACSVPCGRLKGSPEANPSVSAARTRPLADSSRSVRRAGAGRALELMLVIDDQWRVVGEARLGPDGGRLNVRFEPGADDLIVDAPAHVLLPGLATVGPPGVLIRQRVHHPERVDVPALIKQLVEPGALFRKETGILLIGAPVLQVDRPVRDVEVPAQHVLPSPPPQAIQVGAELGQKPELGRLPFRTR